MHRRVETAAAEPNHTAMPMKVGTCASNNAKTHFIRTRADGLVHKNHVVVHVPAVSALLQGQGVGLNGVGAVLEKDGQLGGTAGSACNANKTPMTECKMRLVSRRTQP